MQRLFARRELEGVDLYWPYAEKTLDGHLDSVTNFAKVWMDDYPFHM